MNKVFALNISLNHKCINNNLPKTRFSVQGYYLQKYEPADLCFKDFLYIFDTKSWTISHSLVIHIRWSTEFNTDIVVDSLEVVVTVAAFPFLPSCSFIVYMHVMQMISFSGLPIFSSSLGISQQVFAFSSPLFTQLLFVFRREEECTKYLQEYSACICTSQNLH